MGLKAALKNLFNTLAESHGPFYPAPDVQAKLEAVGYKFQNNNAISLSPWMGPVPCFTIYTAKGEIVGGGTLWRSDEITQQYYKDYNAAVAACQPAAAPAGPQPN